MNRAQTDSIGIRDGAKANASPPTYTARAESNLFLVKEKAYF